MKVRIGDGATGEEAEAIAGALARHLGTDVDVYVGDEDDAAANAEPPAEAFPLDDDLSPTEREEQLKEEIADILGGGPQKYKDRLPEQGKLFVRDRLDLWFPEGLKFEDGKFANFDSWHEDSPEVEESDPNNRLPGDGLLTGAAEFEDRDLHFMANDFTVKAGSMARRGVEKFLRMQQRALKTGKPVLYLMDSSGGRIDQQTGFFANREGIGKYYYNHSMLSGYVPQICVLYGPCIAGAAYTPVFADFTIMVEGMSAMAIASPRMVKMVTGEEIDMQDLGGAHMHAQESGSADLVARDEEHARELVAQLITYLPDKAGEKPPRSEPKPPRFSPEGIDELIPESPNRAYDVHDLIARIADAESVFELKPDYGKEIVTAFARIDGRPVGIVANQPTERSGAIFPDAAEKAAEFIWTCDAYEIPLLYLCDTPGFMAGSQVEKDAILEKGKKFIYATSSATVPKQTVIVRKAYGAGIYAMGGPAYDPDSVIGLPSGEIGIMGPEAAINAVYANKLNAIDDPEERKAMEDELREEYREDINVHRMASEVVIDEIVPPSTLREELVNRFEFYADVDKSLPDKKHGTIL
ncbi:acyl-CoA carboxylase subunit beta [Haloferax larsenii]|uniref:Acetyl-CoA carboxylase, carboxyltransferase component n=1 Tax=Haloferax larsenii TaxID=302484 RepID=A0A1H7JAS0_HALLR|nr:acyl-CoA carboxylase subunit beta [Haloferax larsenii]ELZ82278.1 propionyl-CoA carboxylase complex B chain [Haloferax larsenii JCM 13917]UVE49684.1 acyl-CoA carboxylase subunit beta [Haloferax larsenii]SEK71636.1 Acetyl-CoA carboxylase, carboxyltransferase component [Haloferax larsenii]